MICFSSNFYILINKNIKNVCYILNILNWYADNNNESYIKINRKCIFHLLGLDKIIISLNFLKIISKTVLLNVFKKFD